MMKISEKKKINHKLEETIAIISLIAKLILKDFAQYLEKFKIKPFKKINDSYITDEDLILRENIRIFKESEIFLTDCFLVYKSLSKQLEDMVFSLKEFHNLRHFIARARFNFSALISNLKNQERHFVKDNEVTTIYIIYYIFIGIRKVFKYQNYIKK